MKLKELIDSTKKAAIARALIECEHNARRTAVELGVSIRSLYYWMKEYGFTEPQNVRDFLNLD